MTNQFPTGASKGTYKECVFLEQDSQEFKITSDFEKMLNNKVFYDMLKDWSQVI